jgi:hypothetical protein
MLFPVQRRSTSMWILLAILMPVSACNLLQKTESVPVDQAAAWFSGVAGTQDLKVSNAEISELSKAHNAGLSDQSCISLIKLARARQKPFDDGQSIANLISAGSSEQTVLELARLDQLGLWAGQAQALRLAGLSDTIILAVADRRSRGASVMSPKSLADLKNAGVSDAAMLDMIHQGTGDEQAKAYVVQRQRAAGGHSFVYQGRSRKSR